MLKQFAKFIAAGITAFALLNIFCLVYQNVPGHISGTTGATDYVYPQYARYSQMAEGFGYGRLNNEGYNNIDDYNSQNIDILLMGSSHMDGMQVKQSDTTASMLNNLSRSKYTYNIGFSTHNFLRNLNNLKDAVNYYQPQQYVVLEMSNVVLNIRDIEKAVCSKLERLHAFDYGIFSYLSKIPYVRVGYRQIRFFTGLEGVDTLRILAGNNSEPEPEKKSDVIDWERTEMLLDLLMERTHQICSDSGIDLVIFYHPHLTIEKDGHVSVNSDNEYLLKIKNACSNNGIYFMDMTDAFIAEYNAHHILPHGFFNTAVGSGHLNKNGHRIIANQLFEFFTKMEKEGVI
jgi:hypothetical protein